MNRRDVLQAGGVSIAIAAAVPLGLFNPREARAQGAPFQILSPEQVATIEALCEALVPGAREAGVAHYIDHELASPSPRLMLRFAQLPGPMAPYYQSALSGFAATLRAQGNGAFGALSADAQHTVIEALRTGTLKPWEPGSSSVAVAAPVFYGMMRNDGVDVVYGSAEGFKNMGIPYMPHIMPKTTW